MSENSEEKTEDPTQKRLDEAKKKGQIAFSREVSSFGMILAFTLIISSLLPNLLENASNSLSKYIAHAHEFSLQNAALEQLMTMAFMDIAKIGAVAFGILILAAFIPSFLQTGINFSIEPIIPKFEKISPLKGFGRIFSKRSFIEFLKGIAKITILLIICSYIIWSEMQEIELLPKMNINDILSFMLNVSVQILVAACIMMFLIAIADFVYQKQQHIKQLMMSLQEVKDEYKQQEGDPKVKGKLKQLRMERTRKRMMAAVPSADVVITNPTHYAVALKYEHNKMEAPIVVAIGADLVALRIKKLAEDNKVPVVRNAPLARALHEQCDVEQPIPLEHFKAVAEIISYVYKLKGRKF